jgi:hypothetical protein
MTDKSSLLRAFNTHFFDFIEDLLGIFPNNNDLVLAKSSFDTIKKANPTAIIKSWIKFVYLPYKEVIDNGDISFFFDKDYSEDLSAVSNANKILNIIDTLRPHALGCLVGFLVGDRLGGVARFATVVGVQRRCATSLSGGHAG